MDNHRFLSDLYDALDSQPESIAIQERLVEAWKDIGVEGKVHLSFISGSSLIVR